MRGRPKPLSDYVGASNVFVYGFHRYVVVILFFVKAKRQGDEVISHTMLRLQS